MGIKDISRKFKKTTMDTVKSIAKRSISDSYKIPEIVLKLDGDSVDVEVLEKTMPNTYIEIKHRITGRRLEYKIENQSVRFTIDEVLEMADYGVFDFYAKTKVNKFQNKMRIRYNNKNQLFKGISKDKNIILRTYSTKQNNISLKVERRDFDHNITELSVYDNNKVLVKGNVEVFNEEIENVNKIIIMGRNRLDSQSNVFDLDIKKYEDGKIYFEGIIDDIKVPEDEILNLRMDFYIRIYDDDIYYQNLIDLSNYKDYSNDENRFLLPIKTHEHLYSYYATENKNSLALWITSEEAWEKSYTIAKGRTIYRNTVKEDKINKKMIFFESFLGKAYSGNPKYIYEKMLEMGYGDKYTFVWSYREDNPEIIPGNPIIVKRDEAGDYYKYLAQAKYWVNNIIFPIHIKRGGNVYLQTWHGTPLKKLGYDITIPGPEVEGRTNFYNESRNWDYLISSNEYSSEIFKRAFKFYKEILELGYPANDIFFKDNTELIKDLKKKLNIPESKKVILYAPTWKDDEQNDTWEHYFNLEIDLEKLYSKFNEDHIILLKMHHLISERLNIPDTMKDFAIDVSNWDDIQELYLISDLLITDYSSVFFDYAHSKRPILFFVPDLNHYIENVRGLYLNMEKELPGPLIKDNDKLIESIENIDQITNEYSDRYDEFYNRFCSICDGHSAQNIIEKIFKK